MGTPLPKRTTPRESNEEIGGKEWNVAASRQSAANQIMAANECGGLPTRRYAGNQWDHKDGQNNEPFSVIFVVKMVFIFKSLPRKALNLFVPKITTFFKNLLTNEYSKYSIYLRNN